MADDGHDARRRCPDSLVVRITLPFLLSTSDHAGLPTAQTRTPATVSVPGPDPSRDASSAASPPTATGRSNAPPIQPSTAVSTSSASPGQGTDGCENGDAAACVALAHAAEATKDFERAANLYLKACSGRAAAGCTGLGVWYNRGSGVSRDAAQAALYYERGCTLGDMSGCNNLGTVYEFGSIGFRDLVKAAGLDERACSTPKWTAARISRCCYWARLAQRRKRKHGRANCSRRHAQPASRARAARSSNWKKGSWRCIAPMLSLHVLADGMRRLVS